MQLKSSFVIREPIGIDETDLQQVPISNLYTEFVNKDTKKSAENILIDDDSALKVNGIGHLLKFDLKDKTYTIFAIGLKTGFEDNAKRQIISIGLDKIQSTKNEQLEFIKLPKWVISDRLYMNLQGNTIDLENNIKRIILYGYPVKIYDPNKIQK